MKNSGITEAHVAEAKRQLSLRHSNPQDLPCEDLIRECVRELRAYACAIDNILYKHGMSNADQTRVEDLADALENTIR